MEARVFIGSSSESLKIANMIAEKLSSKTLGSGYSIIASTWDKYPGAKKGNNETFMQKFKKVLDVYDFGLFILSKDDLVISRGQILKTARDNVWLEAGMFIGRKGLENVYLFTNRNDFSETKIPTDLFGVLLNNMVTWESPVVDLYLNENSILYEASDENRKVKEQVETQLEEQIEEYCKNVLEDIDDKLSSKIESERAEILKDEDKCFEIGIGLVKNASTRLYTTISFADSFSPEMSPKEKEMEAALIQVAKNTKISFKRYFKTEIDRIKDQFTRFNPLINGKEGILKSKLEEIDFDYAEMIISDDSVLLVFPDYDTQDEFMLEKVGFGLLISENARLADVLSALLHQKIANNN